MKNCRLSTDNRIGNSEYPRITIITPSYNQGQFIEETICSVLMENYPNLEYIITDGGSTDNSVEIIKKYEKHLAYWVSEPDRGQTHAINKGIARATGDILAYLNSDDYYLSGTLFKVAEYFRQFPQTDLLHGRCRYVNEQGEKIGEQFANIQSFAEIIDLWGIWWQERQFVQPEVFWSRRITEQIGHFREDLHYVMDYEYWCRILKAGGVVGRLDAELTCFRFTSTQKSNHSEAVADELLQVVQPWLWSHQTVLPQKDRSRLQGQWLYQAVLMKQIEQSVQKGDHKYIRWLKSAFAVMQCPQLLFVSSFQERAKHFFSRLSIN
ncbi:glycosyltransferase [Cyanobacteria bacterium FACHB-502]|nr:glycosyltransferase [Cyanobacteria bacterium FACHB-502]